MFNVEVIGTKRASWQFEDGRRFDGYTVYFVGRDPLESGLEGKQCFKENWSLDTLSGLNLSPGSELKVEYNRRGKLLPYHSEG